MKKTFIALLLFASVTIFGQTIPSVYFSGNKLPSNDIYELAKMSLLRSGEFEKAIVNNLQFKKVGYQGENIMFQKGDSYTDGGGAGRLTIEKSTIKMSVSFEWQMNIYEVQRGNSEDIFQKTLEQLGPFYKETKYLDGESLGMMTFEVPYDGMLFYFSIRRPRGITFLTVLRMG